MNDCWDKTAGLDFKTMFNILQDNKPLSSAFSVAVTESHELGSTEGKRIINHVVLETQGARCQNIWHLSGEVFLLGHDMAEDVTRQGSLGLSSSVENLSYRHGVPPFMISSPLLPQHSPPNSVYV